MEVEHISKSPASQGWVWFKLSWRLFMMAPGFWMLSSVATLLCFFLLRSLPEIGMPVATLFLFVAMAGFVNVCHALASGMQPHPMQIFHGLQLRLPALVIIGAVDFVAEMLLMNAIQNEDVGQKVAATLIGLLIFMGVYFAPVHIMLKRAGVVHAVTQSFSGCTSNLSPLAVYLMCMLLPMFLGMISLGALVIVIPVTVAGTYLAWRDVYTRRMVAESEADAPPEEGK